jgi:aryl-alcohol dehydrogenase-like predicted oxidoreductase
MLQRPLGKTTLKVSVLGLGGGPLGDFAIDDRTAEMLVRGAFDLGVNVVDTAPSYAASESRIGRVLRTLSPAERDRVVVITKGGYGIEGVADWSPEVIDRGVDRALRELATDRIDVFLLHSCPKDRLAQGDLLAPLERAKKAGKVRAVGYSGDGDALAWAVSCEAFDVVECSVNVADQEALAGAIPRAALRGVGVLAKRAMAGAAWSDPKSAYTERWRTMFRYVVDPDELAVRFAAFAPGVASALVGTRHLERLKRAADHVGRGPLAEDLIREVRERFAAHGSGGRWPGII